MELALRISEVAFGGSGVGKADGKVIFVPFSIDGELLQVRITQSHKSFSLASVQAILQTSPHREEPPCPYYQTCGGCDYQHIQYAHQLELKRLQVEQALRRIAKLPEIAVPPVIPSPKIYGFRNRIKTNVLPMNCNDGSRIGRALMSANVPRWFLLPLSANSESTHERSYGLVS